MAIDTHSHSPSPSSTSSHALYAAHSHTHSLVHKRRTTNSNHSTHNERQSEFLAFGFCHEHEKQHRLVIPDYVIKLVQAYSTKYIILGNGKNYYGALGIGDEQPNGKWIRLKQLESLLPSISNLFIHYSSVFIVDVFNVVYATGQNRYSRLGIEDDGSWQISSFSKIIDAQQPVICSNGIGNYHHSFIYLVDDNQLLVNGNNKHGQFGNGQRMNQISVVSSIPCFWGNTKPNNPGNQIKKIVTTFFHSLFLTEEGNLYCCGGENGKYGLTPKRIKSGIRDIDGGENHYLLLDKHGKFEVHGSIGDGVCDLNVINRFFVDNEILVKYISCGINHGVVISMNNTAYSFGRNSYGQCGNGKLGGFQTTPFCIIKPKSVSKISCSFHTLLLSTKNNVYSFGCNEYKQCASLLEDEHVVTPFLVDKEKELRMNHRDFIYDIFALTYESLIIIDPSKKLR
eukprot:CAMPEP_0197077082 /NCGR_PEP_ID=MMETSP1384-20130603/212439_1 /TAXON_ID=29189 /ORGANISM="Ammonia sp." /LENGTH=453 /DNA_ID=CAMNT_0042515941 /DNA_START=216 /DNA_END=1577 /DNA_ORIENTATION=+